MHSFGHTFAHSSQPMHLNQSMLCWPRYASGSSTFWYGYRWVTGFRPPGTRRLIPGIVTSACLIVASNGRTVPPIVPTLRRPWSGSDLGDFIRVLALLHVHQLALARAHEAALLRPHPSAPLGLDLRAQLEEAVDQGLRPHRAARDEDVGRHERVRALDDGVRVVVRPAADRALAHRDHPLRLGHLFVQPADGRAEFQGDRAVQEEDIALARRGPVDDAEALDVIPRVRGRRHLDRAAHDAEVQRPGRVPLGPVEELANDAAFQSFEERAAGPPFHRRVDVRLFRALDHGLIASVGGWVACGRSPRMAESLLTLRPWRCTDGNESWA